MLPKDFPCFSDEVNVHVAFLLVYQHFCGDQGEYVADNRPDNEPDDTEAAMEIEEMSSHTMGMENAGGAPQGATGGAPGGKNKKKKKKKKNKMAA